MQIRGDLRLNMKNIPLILSANELQILSESYKKGNALTPYNKSQLSSELSEPRIVDRDNLPANVVSLFSKVLLWNMTKGQTFTIHITPDVDSSAVKTQILPSDPLSIALLGYQEGSIIEWEMNDGINKFKIVSVSKGDRVGNNSTGDEN